MNELLTWKDEGRFMEAKHGDSVYQIQSQFLTHYWRADVAHRTAAKNVEVERVVFRGSHSWKTIDEAKRACEADAARRDKEASQKC